LETPDRAAEPLERQPEKPSVLSQIREAKNAVKQPQQTKYKAKSGPER
jgi:hypothetical protein